MTDFSEQYPSSEWLDQMAAEHGKVTINRGDTIYIVEVRKHDL